MHNPYLKTLFCVIFLTAGFAASSVDGPSPTPTSDPFFQYRKNEFSIALLKALFREKPAENLSVSPLSLEIALRMALNGARGKTQKEMEQVLGLKGMTLDQSNDQSLSLYGSLTSPGDHTELDIANSIWVDNKSPLFPDFIQRTQKYYGAEVSNLDFSDPKTPEVVNQWVSQKTHQKITKMIDSFFPGEAALLMNAVYFKGLWKSPFKEKATVLSPFHLKNGKTTEVSMMNRSSRTEGVSPYFLYLENDLFQAVRLPYQDVRFALCVFLPKKGKTAKDILDAMNPEKWEVWSKAFGGLKGELALPRFKVESVLGLNPALSSMGLDSAFRDGADFSGMTWGPIKISRVFQKTYIEVNEKGTEAAAATGIPFEFYSAEELFSMVVDHPFLYALCDQKTGTILFMGIIYDPGASDKKD